MKCISKCNVRNSNEQITIIVTMNQKKTNAGTVLMNILRRIETITYGKYTDLWIICNSF